MRRRRSGEKHRSPGEDDFSSEDGGPLTAFRMTIFPDGNREKTFSLESLEIRFCTKNRQLEAVQRPKAIMNYTCYRSGSVSYTLFFHSRTEQQFYIPIRSKDLTVSTKSSTTGRLPTAAN